MKNVLKKLSLIIALILILGQSAFAQLSAPNVENVYGGRILAITGYARTADTARIFISTESANSIFYTDVTSNASPPVFAPFTVMPGVNASAGYGSAIKYMNVNELSGSVFFVSNSQLLSSNPSSSTVNVAYNADINGLLIEDNYLFFTESGRLHFGTVDASDNFTEDSSSPLAVPGIGGANSIIIDPTTNYLYIFSGGPSSPVLVKTSDIYTVLSGSTTISNISLSSLSTSTEWTAFNIAPDGTFYMMGHQGQDKYCAYSTDGGSTWSEYSMGKGGISGDNIAFGGTSPSYSIYSANVFNNNNGNPADWHYFGESGLETHPNDGRVFVDPINKDIVYLTTDQGIGATTDGGYTIFEIDDGVEAVQVNDFSMTPSKYRAWTASKSGLRRVDNYTGTPTWTNAIFPNGDGSPYHCIELGHNDTNLVYAGNLRIYKSTDNGSTWRQVFTPEDPPYSFPRVEIFANAVKECKWNTNIVMAGWEMQDSLRKGGLFYSNDSGHTWQQLLIKATTIGEDVDVMDIVFNLEGSDTVAYVGVKYELSSPSGYSVYRLVKSGSTWTVSQDMLPGHTSTGSVIVASIYDLYVSVTGDTLFAAGTDAGTNHPIVYYKDLTGTGLWTPFTTSGFPFGNEKATAVTLGNNILYCAVDEEIYYYDLTSSTSWNLGYSYPVGTKINFLYYDDLLVGTSFGLYGHTFGTTSVRREELTVNRFDLRQNYPNPFNPTTTIEYSIPNVGTAHELSVHLIVYDILGREVATLVNEKQTAGAYSVIFNANGLTSGVYFYRLKAGNYSAIKKMILLK